VAVGTGVVVADGVGVRVILPCAIALANSSRACCVASGEVRDSAEACDAVDSKPHRAMVATIPILSSVDWAT
jgi:hypothetical protein